MIKMSNYFIDASVWIALILKKDSLHQQAIELTRKILTFQNKIYTSDYILDESLTRIKRKDEGVTAKKFLNNLPALKTTILYTNKSLFQKTIKIFNQHSKPKSFSFTDAHIIASMKHNKIKNLLSFDQDLQKIAQKYKIVTMS